MEKGHPKTASLPPTMAATDNSLLSGMGGTMVPQKGWWGAGQEGAGQRASFTPRATSSPALGPSKSWSLCPHQGWAAAAPAFGSSSTRLCCVSQHLSEPLVFLPATGHQ